jgi:NAD-dependent deacetylase
MKKLMVLTGAGISAPSGIQTFRGTTGMWNDHHIDQVCNISTWKQNFEIVHTFYNDRRTSLAPIQPNIGHQFIANWATRYPDRVTIMTQNIDNLFEKAGCNNVVHLHGDLQNMKCIACGNIWNIGYTAWNHVTDRCPKCNSLKGVKPGVIFFGEGAPHYRTLYKEQGKLGPDDTFVIIGTSGIVIDINYLTQTSQVFSILNNLEKSSAIDDTNISQVFYESVETAIGKIDEIVTERMK